MEDIFSTQTRSSKDKLIQDVKEVIADSEALLKDTAHDLSAKAQETRSRLTRRLEAAKNKLMDLQEVVQEKAMQGIKHTDKLVREHPYESIGMAFGLGLLVGILINRR